MRMSLKIRFFVSVLVLFATINLLASFARGQQTLGTINGTITDTSGAAVPDALVTATAEATGLTRAMKTQKNGYFEILNLPVGIYTVTLSLVQTSSPKYSRRCCRKR